MRNVDARAILSAGILFLLAGILLVAPASVHASALVWGDQEGGEPAQISILDGGTYAVPLNVAAEAYINVPESYGINGATLYRIIPGDDPVREEIVTLFVHDFFDEGDVEFAWPQAGQYELDFFGNPEPPPFFNLKDTVRRWLARIFFAEIAYAQFEPLPVVETMHFTIEEETSTPDPVIIIPGILGSAQHNGEWLIDPITHAYDNLIDTLVANGYEKGVTLFPFPYEWRFSNRTTATLLDAKIDDIKAICTCDKVDIVAHSMGGLVARQYIQSSDYDQDVDQLIFLGTPHLGAPKAYLMWEGGEGDRDVEGKLLKHFLRIEAIKHGYLSLFDYIRATPIPSVQELLPVYGYIKHVGSLLIPSYPNSSWYPNNLFLHELKQNVANLDNSGVEISNFVGQLTASTTISTIRVVAPQITNATSLWGFGKPQGFGNSSTDQGLERGVGDGTVPLFSATFIDEDLKFTEAEHSDLVTIAEGDVFRELTDSEPTVLINQSHGILGLDVKMLIFQILSPADFVVEAPNGLKVGKDFATGQEFTQIPDAFYSGFGTDDEYVTIPNPLNGLYKVVTQGTGTGGAFTIATGLITEATSSEKFFTGQTLPGLLTTFHVDVGLNGPSAAIKDIQIVATVGSTQLDIKRAYALGWLKSSTIRDSLLLLLTQAQKFKKQSDKIKLYNAMLAILKAAKKTGMINQQGYDLLTADINWLATH